MKTKHLKSTLALVTATLVMVLFNNFEYVNWSKILKLPVIETVNEASRVAHAKELLGGRYKGSAAQKIEGRVALNLMIYKKVQGYLEPQWKNRAGDISSAIISESDKFNLDPVFVMAIIKTESTFNPLTVGSFGEIGLMQIKPDTAQWIANKYGIPWKGKKTLTNPVTNIRIGAAYMDYLRKQFPGKANKYVSAYNMGPKNVRRLLAQNVMPEEYNGRVMKNYKDFYTGLADAPTIQTTVATN
ncbi:lytic transglycosylase domain-containing protein [Bdellovibrio sp. HCB185ZH]|uniref:lytic transglycosylase domain-containing protein n=1 Tax=Bdellovibrio sp. HCB185ZH TaxID=3394235 RepID=UPI0039A6AAAF